MKMKGLTYRVVLLTCILTAFIYPVNLFPTEVKANPIAKSYPNMNEQRGASIQNIFHPFDENKLFIPILMSGGIPPCGSIPNLLLPADGSTVTLSTKFKLDGHGKINDWLELDFIGETEQGTFLQPAGLWDISLGELGLGSNLTPGTWHWRASLWCNGPGWPPPPEGYDHSPYSEMRSFTLQ